MKDVCYNVLMLWHKGSSEKYINCQAEVTGGQRFKSLLKCTSHSISYGFYIKLFPRTLIPLGGLHALGCLELVKNWVGLVGYCPTNLKYWWVMSYQ